MEEYIQKGKNILEIVLILVLLFCFIKLACFYMPFLIAYIIASLLDPIIKFINRKFKLTRKVITIIALILILTSILGILIWGMINLFNEANNLLNGLNNYFEKATKLYKSIIDNINIKGLDTSKINLIDGVITDFLKMITDYTKNILLSIINAITHLPNLFINVIITLLAIYFFVCDKFYILDSLEFHFSKKLIGKLINIIKRITSSLGEYIKAEIILSIVTFTIILISLNIFYIFGMKLEYPIFTSLLIGFIDLLPIFGAGFILIPWSAILFINKQLTFGFWILGLYFVTLIVKQLLEPKLISQGLGIHPVFTLISMYTGFKLLDVSGLIIGPIILIILKVIFSDTLDKGLVNSIKDTNK